MKIVFVFQILLIISVSNAGMFVEKSLYTQHHMLVGKGSTPEEARRDALSALPLESRGMYYEVDPKNSSAVQCLLEPSLGSSLETCIVNKWQVVVPVLRAKR